MNQENYNDQEIIDLIGDLERVGHGQTLKISLCFDINPNEYLYTNIQIFIDSYFKRNSFNPEATIFYQMKPGGVSMKDKHILTISGPYGDVKKIQKDVDSFEWIKSDSIEIIYETFER